ncbi:hypothetical protein Aspvir_008436 [Aspergillus viridinutans]|uniref:Uncharacterized protein n=1 Tax=Aspergillus viridinutans TaxID=75553 RepID=A0A9P3BWQ0_ASPVI|nr:uncharacterized protein Aspvir_008436 [Aspergillus viridinutans]GIK04355.1 hypothetical protein Aspvir_008436 [Aspergillus viridinutans]
MDLIRKVVCYLTELWRKSSSSDDVDRHDVYPVHFIDQTGIIRDSIVTYMFRYDCVLDPKKLHGSLVQLLEQGDWRKFGGRLRRNIDGLLEIHVPRNDQKQAVVRFSHISYAIQIKEHPLACRLPQKTGQCPSIQEGCHTFRAFSVPPDLPNNIKHYLTTDEPLLSLRIISFTDATLVSITFPHAVTDAMGTADFLRAWSSMLADRLDQLPPVLGARGDVMASVGTLDDKRSQSPHALEHRRIRGLSLVSLILRLVWDRLTRRNIQARTIYLPAEFIARLRQSAQLDSQPSQPSGETEFSFLSDGDLITAWGAQMVLSSYANGGPAIICNVFDLRSRIEDLFDPAGVYLQNLFLPTMIDLQAPPNGHSTMPLGHIARRIRHAIVEQATDAQARRLVRVMRATIASTGLMPLFGSLGATIIACTNWSKAQFREAARFSPAALPSRSPSAFTSGAGCDPGACVAFAGTIISASDNPRDTFMIYGKDDEGNYWIHAYLRQETWDFIGKMFDQHKLGDA